LNVCRNAIIGAGRLGSEREWIETFPGEVFIHVAMVRLMANKLARA
jgi:hypothetical protein